MSYTREYFEKKGTHLDQPINQVIFERLLAEKPKSFLHIGCGKGFIVRRFQIAGIKAAGVDISDYCVATRVANSVIKCDIQKDKLPYKDKEFDILSSVHVTALSNNALVEIDRVGKRLIFTDPAGDSKYRELIGGGTPLPSKYISNMELADVKLLNFQAPQVVPQGVFSGRYVKEDLETMNAENPTRKRALNIGSFTVMYASTPDVCVINTDLEDLRGYAAQNGYNYIYYRAPEKLPFKDATIDAIYCSHMLEHLDRKEGETFLKECFRVLREGGHIRILVPNTHRLTSQYLRDTSDSPLDDFNYVADSLSIHKSYNVSAEQAEDEAEILYHLLLAGHKTCYDAESLTKKLEKCGFPFASIKTHNDTSSPVLDRFIMDMYPEISLIMEAIKPRANSNNSGITENNKNNTTPVSPNSTDSGAQPALSSTARTDELANTGIVMEVGQKASQSLEAEKLDKLDKKSPFNYLAPREINKICLISTPMLQVPPGGKEGGYGGLEKIVYDLAYSLAKLGKDVTVIAPDGSHVEGCKMFHIGPEVGTVQVDWKDAESKAYEKYKTFVADGKFDVIHDHTWFGFAYILKEKFPQLPICHTHHGGLNWRGKPPFVKDLNLFAISKWMQTVYQSQGFSNVKYCYNGIDISDYKLETEKGKRLVFVGRLDSFKQPHIAINVARQAGMDIDVVGGTFVQDRNYMQQVLNMCKDHAKAYPDALQAKKIELMQRAKAIVLPSHMGEPFGLVAVEAMSVGTPVVCLDDGALREVVADGVTGFVCKNEQEMVQAVKRIDLINPLECRARVEQMFTREKMAENYLKLYGEIVI